MAIYQFEEIGSTNDYMKQHREEFLAYDIVTAKEQKAGKGRRGNIWLSQEGMAMFTFKFTKKQGDEDIKYMKLPLLVGLAVIRACKHFYKGDYAFKWTNDVFLAGKKLSGILVERSKEDFFIGVGLNVNNRLPEEIQHIATSLREESKESYELLDLIVTVVEEFRKLWQAYEEGRWPELLEEINGMNYLKGKAMALRAGNFFVEGRVKEIDENGELCLLTKEGEEHFGIGEVVRRRLLYALEPSLESFAKAYVLKEANYDLILSVEEDFPEEWEEKLAFLSCKLERGQEKEALEEKYGVEFLGRTERVFPLEEYTVEEMKAIAEKMKG